jgi:hypothetical protein
VFDHGLKAGRGKLRMRPYRCCGFFGKALVRAGNP